MAAQEAIRAELARVAAMLGAPASVVVELETPREKSHGDLSTNLAMTLSKPLRAAPRQIAEKIVAALALSPGVVAAVEIAGPGFINFRLAPDQLAGILSAIIAAGKDYGREAVSRPDPVNVEFVSANPTGPLHVGHGRQAALGDAISSLLEWTGWKVTREFYYNDGGAQILNLAASVQGRVAELGGRAVGIPEGGYHGEYIRELAQRYVEAHPADREGNDLEAIRRFAVRELRQEQDRDLHALGIRFDGYYLESALYTEGKVDETVRRLVAAGHTYERDGALWLRTTDFGDDKDRVMRRSAEKGGELTYFVPDVAYHVTKWERGFRRAINVQGADHHSTVTRVRVGLQALGAGIAPGYPEYVLHQMVTVMKGGEELKISKRAGSYVTVRDLIDEVGRDAVRYFFLMRKGDSHLQFDIDLALKHTDENPVYYVQMAHARMAGIFRVGGVDPAAATADGVDVAVLADESEPELLKVLSRFPDVVQRAADALEPHRITAYCEELARAAHHWYHRCRVLGEPPAVERARLALARATKIVLANGLALLGLTAPKRM
ncbi:MAG: arginine--tRNA ligase [Gemmatimonadales bacterium]|nr:arginine--tRNA ligase [Gemmatimonadales bacterium]